MNHLLLTIAAAMWTLLAVCGCNGKQPTASADSYASPSASSMTAARPLGPGAFKVEWVNTEIPPNMKAGQEYRFSITLKNSGNEAWPAVGVGQQQTNRVSVSYHWLHPEQDKVIVQEGARSELPKDLAPGSQTPLEVLVVAPGQPGLYRLQLTLVQEEFAWFETQGGKPLTQRVEVE